MKKVQAEPKRGRPITRQMKLNTTPEEVAQAIFSNAGKAKPIKPRQEYETALSSLTK